MLGFKKVERVRPGGLELKERLVTMKRVCKVTKGRRYFSFSAVVVKGDENGVVGYGFGKSKEAPDAIYKAGEQAKKNLVRVPMSKGTIPHEQEGKFSGARVFIRPASEGTGILAGGSMRAVLELAGVSNVLSKSKGSSNPHNVVKATIRALISLRSADVIAKERGISIKKLFKG
ncbi:MAG: 30S ribosomal protein S5 [Flavobacteriales bacterium AspAUS03]